MAGETIALLLTLLIGVSLGALGSGGSIVTLPVLVYVAGVAPQSAVGMSIAIVGGTSLAGSWFHWRRGNLFPKAALLFSAAGIPGAYPIIPALVWFAGLGARRAIGTSLGIIAINSAAGLAGQLRYTEWDWQMTARFVVCSLIGMGLGIPVATRAPERSLRRAFAIVVLTVAVAIGRRELGRH